MDAAAPGSGAHLLPAAHSSSASRSVARPWARWGGQAILLAALALAIFALVELTRANLAARNIQTGFGFLDDRAGFAIGDKLIAYAATDSFGRAILVGLLNTLLVSALAILCSTVLGFAIGLARLSTNWLLASVASAYVEIVRNLPLLLQLFVWYAVFLFGLPSVETAQPGLFGITVTNRAIYLPGLDHPAALILAAAGAAATGLATAWWLRPAARQGVAGARAVPIMVAIVIGAAAAILLSGSPRLVPPRLAGFNFEAGGALSTEFVTLLVGLTVYTSAYIGEIVRGGIAATAQGQSEAAAALGLSSWQRLRHVVLPQALRIIIPPMTSWHVNTIKNSSLAVAIGFPELVSVVDTIINQTGQAIEGVAIIVATFLALSLLLSAALNLYGARRPWAPGTASVAGRAPPRAETPDLTSVPAFVAWARRSLFGTWPQVLATVVLLAALGTALSSLVNWAILDSTFVGGAERCRQRDGACWLFIGETHRLILFGTYPQAEQWRPALVCLLFPAALAASFVKVLWSRALLFIWLGVLVLSLILMSGGLPGLAVVPPDKWSGLPVTFLLATIAVVGAFPLAVLLALGRQSHLPLPRALCIGFIEVMRGVPLIGVLFMAAVMFPLFVPDWLNIDSFMRVQIALVLFTAAYMAEAVRGGLLAVPPGQNEAAAALGLTRWQSLRHVRLPQALKASIPGIVSTAISEVKNTTLVLIVGIYDLLQTTRMAFVEVQWRPYYVEAYTFTGAIFFALCLALSRLSLRVERHFGRGQNT
ncbi:ABC transporter permease subunit [Sphingosinicella sp. LHD-64]|uniref:ABC transporter permease subunit n=1 Tax=Sphingosinicella sp. LHD-64 TaxID=3072139 RepID=UPI00281014A0|nr:ABC transporter permease subunit [Sphingosinicella sp. LHD-64]MDQ8757374.1 ABC transporter permease subunit [Sphingosinicella sp. LHD-64]